MEHKRRTLNQEIQPATSRRNQLELCVRDIKKISTQIKGTHTHETEEIEIPPSKDPSHHSLIGECVVVNV